MPCETERLPFLDAFLKAFGINNSEPDSTPFRNAVFFKIPQEERRFSAQNLEFHCRRAALSLARRKKTRIQDPLITHGDSSSCE